MALADKLGIAHLRTATVLRPALIALAFVVLALAVTFPLQRWITYPFLFLFYGAIVGSAWMGGMVAGIISAALSSLVVNYFFIPPVYSIEVADEAESFLLAFFLCALLLAVVSATRKRVEHAIRQANDRLETLVQERTAALEQSNREILERERNLRELTEAIPQQIWRADAAGRIEHLNQHLRGYLGEVCAAGLDTLFERVVHPDDRPLYASAWSAALARGARFEVEARVCGADGQYCWFLIRGNPHRGSDGAIACWYGTQIEIEEQHRAQQGLVAAQDELLRLSKTLTMAEMAASIAHELNQPMTAVVTHAYACREWLREETLNLAKASATAEKIVKESTRASDVVRRVRALFQKEAPASQHVDLNQLISRLSRLLRDEAIRRNVSIHLDLAKGLPHLEVDPVLMQQVLLNLTANAMDAMSQSEAKRDLLISTALTGQAEVQITVRDKGPGVPEALQKQIFEPFFSTKSAGTGMGLAICRSIIEAHGGRLSVTNASDGGAIFQFTLRAVS